MNRIQSILLVMALGAVPPSMDGQQPSVRIEPFALQGTRQLQDQTAKAAIHDYLASWQSMSEALDQNRTELLDRDFVGSAKDKLADVIKQQRAAGIHSVYSDQSHDVQLLFYSPEGLSIELADTVQYEATLLQDKKVLGDQHVQARYIVVLTPSEVRWLVRIFEANSK